MLIKHTLNERVQITGTTIAEQFEGAKGIVETYIIPLMTQYDNISYIGAYESGTSKKYVIDIGLEHIAMCLYLNNVKLIFGLCKKSDVDSLEYLVCQPSYSVAGGFVSMPYVKEQLVCYSTISALFYMVVHGNEAKVLFNICPEGTTPLFNVIIDVDNFGKKYAGISTPQAYPTIYYDKEMPVVGYCDSTTISNVRDGYVTMQKIILKENSIVQGISSENMLLMRNDILSTNSLLQIDVEGNRYIQFENYFWYKVDE